MTLIFKVQQNPKLIYNYLSDMQKFVSVHPVISKMDVLGNNKYLVHETLKMGKLPISFRYPVTVRGDSNKHEVFISATVMKLTKVEMHFKISQEKDHSLIEESIIFTSPLPIKPLMRKIFKKQHEQLFRNIDALV